MREPAYMRAYESGLLQARTDEALAAMASCTVCPRDCRINRLRDERLVCRVGRRARVASCFAHFGEEDCLRGARGSGTIFFSWCNLKCVFCQNWETSNEGAGEEVDGRALAGMMLELQKQGCHNINFVTPEHVVPQILEALIIAIRGGLRLPLVYNTSAYDSLHTLALLDGIVDIYMPDFKYWDASRSHLRLKARDYPLRARDAITAMHRQVGDLIVDADGIARRGLLVRHLVMPDGLADTTKIMRWLAALSPATYVNVMAQYHPAGRVSRAPHRYPEIASALSPDVYRQAVAAAFEAGLSRVHGHPRKPDLRAAI